MDVATKQYVDTAASANTLNWVNGDATGSVRTINSNSSNIGQNATAEGEQSIAAGQGSHAEGGY